MGSLPESNFAAITRLPLLHSLYGTVYIAQAVYEEAQDGLEEGYTFLEVIDEYIFPFHSDGWLRLVNLEDEEEFHHYQQTPPKLHRGEAVSLAIAAHRKWKFLTDDRGARRYARKLGVEIGGTLGTLVLLIKHDILSLAEASEQRPVHCFHKPPQYRLR